MAFGWQKFVRAGRSSKKGMKDKIWKLHGTIEMIQEGTKATMT